MSGEPFHAIGRRIQTPRGVGHPGGNLRARELGGGAQGLLARAGARYFAGGTALICRADLAPEAAVPEAGVDQRDQKPDRKRDRQHHSFIVRLHAKKLPI